MPSLFHHKARSWKKMTEVVSVSMRGGRPYARRFDHPAGLGVVVVAVGGSRSPEGVSFGGYCVLHPARSETTSDQLRSDAILHLTNVAS